MAMGMTMDMTMVPPLIEGRRVRFSRNPGEIRYPRQVNFRPEVLDAKGVNVSAVATDSVASSNIMTIH
jgi:hypothetical protein